MKKNQSKDIVATIGPASESMKTLSQLSKVGLTIARLNMSHGDIAEHEARIKTIQELNKTLKNPIAILQDLSGPKIRTGDFPEGKETIKEGSIVVFTTDTKIVNTATHISINYAKLPEEVKVGDRILLNDGALSFKVSKIEGSEIYTKCSIGGTIKSRRGVNLPDTYLSISALTAEDKKDVLLGISYGVEYIAFSFVKQASDVKDLRKLLDKAGSTAKIISKIETPQALENLDEIISLSDGIMVARGDLGVEIPAEKVPYWQKIMIKKAKTAGKYVICATQMMETMIQNPVPTRAEVSDVYNAIFDGADATMLSAETSLGAYPVGCVKYMATIQKEAVKDMPLFGL